MADDADLVGLLYRADWTRLALSAEVSDGSSILVAPGKRYRYQDAEYVTGCDGDRPWELPGDDEDPGVQVTWVSGPEPPLDRLLCPAWLLVDSRLQVRGRVRACGRDAIDAVMTRRSDTLRSTAPGDEPPRTVEVLVDSESGILLRIAERGHDGEPVVTELVSADFDPVIDPAAFTPPPGSRISGKASDVFGTGGPAWWAVKTAAGLAAGGLGAWIKYSPFGRDQHRAADDAAAGPADTAMAADDPPPQVSPEGGPAGPPATDELLARLHAGGQSEFSATLHEWGDAAAMAAQVPPAARRAGFGGLGLLMDAVSEHPAAVHLVSSVRMAGPGRYQIDHASQPRRGPKTIICDGNRRWQVYADKITAGPAKPPPRTLADLADPSWLLQCRLAGETGVVSGGRPARRISAGRGPQGWASLLFPAAVAVLDDELGILVRLTYYIGGKPVYRYELRDITPGAGFEVELPPGLPVTEETSFREAFGDGQTTHPGEVLAGLAGLAARHAATGAAKAARNLLNRVDPRRPHDPA